jgi:hypothetical protein
VKIEKDFEELLELLNKHKVKYCIVGAYAVAFYGRPRYTKDIDLYIQPDSENSKKIIAALKAFGFKDIAKFANDLKEKNTVIQLGYEPVRIDFLTTIAGCDFPKVWANKKIGYYGKQKAYFIGLKELISNKKKSGRNQDKADLEALKLK